MGEVDDNYLDFKWNELLLTFPFQKEHTKHLERYYFMNMAEKANQFDEYIFKNRGEKALTNSFLALTTKPP